MQATRFAVERLSVDGVPVEASYADLYVVVREGESGPGPSDWEAQLHSAEPRTIPSGRHTLGFDIADGTHLHGEAIVRFSDGTRSLFRGNGVLHGFAPMLVEPDYRMPEEHR